MNIFFLNKDPVLAARAQCDKHVVKMVLETTQMLSTAAIRNGRRAIYQSAYPNHPMTKWVGNTKDNYMWAYEHAVALSKEYTARYGKFHACHKIICLLSGSKTFKSPNFSADLIFLPISCKT